MCVFVSVSVIDKDKNKNKNISVNCTGIMCVTGWVLKKKKPQYTVCVWNITRGSKTQIWNKLYTQKDQT